MDYQQAQEAVEKIVNDLDGEMGIAAWPLSDPSKIIEVNADEIFPTASTFKVPILYSLYRLVDEGKIDPDERVEISHENLTPGSGILQHLQPGLTPSIRDLATLMTIVSDNHATDMLHAMVTPERIKQDMLALELENIEAPVDCRGLLFSLVGMDPNNPEHTYDLFIERAKAKEYDKSSPMFTYEIGVGNDVSSPRDLARLFQHIYEGNGLSEKAQDDVIDILKRQTLNSRIPAGLPEDIEVAHKTGSLEGVRNDAGIIYAEQPYVLAILSKNLADSEAGTQAAIDVSRTVWEAYGDAEK